jgi:RNA polymerase sigma-70 factor (ECF subfamily)
MGLCLKYLKDEDEASDMTMHIYKKLLEKLGDYEVRTFKSWLYTFSKNECLMKLRKGSKVVREIEVSQLEMKEDEEEKYTETHFQSLSKAIEELKAEQRMCIELFYLKELSYNEIESQTGYSWKEIKSHIQNGKRNLRNMIKL